MKYIDIYIERERERVRVRENMHVDAVLDFFSLDD